MCQTVNVHGFLEYDVNGRKFMGECSQFANDAFEIFERLALRKNQTELQPEIGFGDHFEGTDEYTGCLGRL